jgi:YHS domain-containing protein
MKHLFFSVALFSMAIFLIGCHASSTPSTSATSASAVHPVDARKSPNGLDPVNKLDGRLALDGYDVVAYFTEGKAVKGTAEFNHVWLGAEWHFASAASRDAFVKEPEKYAPQFGGYCAWAVAHGYTANGDPTVWKVVDGKLYLNYNQRVKEKWQEDEAGFIKQGDDNFPRFLENKPEHKG